jgi:MoaA/NifB/PqqE/SkfB family radical SAM enzyme
MQLQVDQVPTAPDNFANGLSFLWLELTQKCNLSCSHCYVGSGPNLPLHAAMRHEDWLRTIEQARELGCAALQFIGGEPLLYPRLEELIEFASSLGYELIEIYTNGTPVTAKRASRFSELNVRVACSVYSDSAARHDAVTKVPGSFEKTIQALKELAAQNVPVRVGFIEMETNEGDFERTRNLLSKLGIKHVGHDDVRNFGRGSELVEPEAPVSFPNSPFAGLCGQCSRGRLCVTYTGEVYPCIMSRSHVVGNVLADGLAGVLKAPAIVNFRSGMNAHIDKSQSGDCVPNRACMVCGPGVCGPDRTCSPDHACGPEICSPNVVVERERLQLN